MLTRYLCFHDFTDMPIKIVLSIVNLIDSIFSNVFEWKSSEVHTLTKSLLNLGINFWTCENVFERL